MKKILIDGKTQTYTVEPQRSVVYVDTKENISLVGKGLAVIGIGIIVFVLFLFLLLSSIQRNDTQENYAYSARSVSAPIASDADFEAYNGNGDKVTAVCNHVSASDTASVIVMKVEEVIPSDSDITSDTDISGTDTPTPPSDTDISNTDTPDVPSDTDIPDITISDSDISDSDIPTESDSDIPDDNPPVDTPDDGKETNPSCKVNVQCSDDSANPGDMVYYII